MSRMQIVVLLIEDNPGDVRLVREMLAEPQGIAFSLEWVDSLEAGLQRIAQGGIDLVLLDLGLPDSVGLDTLRRLRAGIPRSIAVVVMSGLNEEELAVQAVQEGAQDYLVKGRFDSDLLIHSIRYAIERQEAERSLRQAHEELERLVLERTAKLASAVQSLEKENAERKKAEEQLLKETEHRKVLLELYEKSHQLSDRELYDFALDHAVRLSDSKIGFFHLVTDDQKYIFLTTWNAEALNNCTAVFETHYEVAIAGNWADCVRFGHPVIYNDFPNSPDQKGLPEGHVPISRFVSIPVIENGKVRIIIGVGNKSSDYDEQDVVKIQLVANELHKIISQRRAERSVCESEEKYRQIVDTANEGIWVLGPDTRTTSVNARMLETLGYTEEEMLGRLFTDFMFEEDIPDHNLRMEKRRQGIAEHYERRLRRKNGETVYTLVSAAPILNSEGQYNGSFGMFTDITERKRAEEHKREFYRSTILAATDGKLLLTEHEEIMQIAGPPKKVFELKNAMDVGEIRNASIQIAQDAGLDAARCDDFSIAIGEVLTNAFKHAGGGIASLHINPNALIFVISDNGPGIEAMTLPKVALVKGYTTAGTLGMGYTIMLSLASKVYLATGPGGTTVGIEFILHPSEALDISALGAYASVGL